MGLADSLVGKRVYFDANIFIYLLEGNEAFKTQIQTLQRLLADGDIEALSSELAFTELLPHPARRGDQKAIQHVVEYLSAFDLVPLTKEITIHAGILRGETGMKSPDALHVACAMQSNCEAFVSNDRGIQTPEGMMNIKFSDL